MRCAPVVLIALIACGEPRDPAGNGEPPDVDAAIEPPGPTRVTIDVTGAALAAVRDVDAWVTITGEAEVEVEDDYAIAVVCATHAGGPASPLVRTILAGPGDRD